MKSNKQQSIEPIDAEKKAKAILEEKYNQKFTKKKISINGKKWEFDLVSNDDTIVSQVKSCGLRFTKMSHSQKRTRFQRDFIFDCIKLEKAQAKEKIFYLFSDPKLFTAFEKWRKGLIPHDVKVVHINAFSDDD